MRRPSILPIEPKWNWNLNVRCKCTTYHPFQSNQSGIETVIYGPVICAGLPSNRTKVELKRKWCSIKRSPARLPIEPKWNWNSLGLSDCPGSIVASNRTKVELKQRGITTKLAVIVPSNRTKVELKPNSSAKTNTIFTFQSNQSGIETLWIIGKIFVTRVFQSNQSGIETHFSFCNLECLCSFQSNQSGIETRFRQWNSCCAAPFQSNQSGIETWIGKGAKIWGTAFQSNQSGIETSLQAMFTTATEAFQSNQSGIETRMGCCLQKRLLPSSNRTKVELKQCKKWLKAAPVKASNRTKVELKRELIRPESLQVCGFQSNQSGIETVS